MVEKACAMLYGKVQVLFKAAGFEQNKKIKYWPECTATTTKLDNLLVNSSKERTAYEIFIEDKIQLRNI
jgi:hypothetical protein